MSATAEKRNAPIRYIWCHWVSPESEKRSFQLSVSLLRRNCVFHVAQRNSTSGSHHRNCNTQVYFFHLKILLGLTHYNVFSSLRPIGKQSQILVFRTSCVSAVLFYENCFFVFPKFLHSNSYAVYFVLIDRIDLSGKEGVGNRE